MHVLLIDGANVVGSRPDGWWRDRQKAARSLVARVAAAAASGQLDGPVVVVLEGQARAGAAAGPVRGIHVVHAPGSGDDTIAEMTSTAAAAVTVVTADRELAARCQAAGATVVGPGWLLARLHDAIV